MFFKLAILLFVVCLANCETKKTADFPPYEEALNFGHRGKNKKDLQDIPPYGDALNNEYFEHIRGKRTGGWGRNGHLQNALHNAYIGHIRGKRDQTQSTKKSE